MEYLCFLPPPSTVRRDLVLIPVHPRAKAQVRLPLSLSYRLCPRVASSSEETDVTSDSSSYGIRRDRHRQNRWHRLGSGASARRMRHEQPRRVAWPSSTGTHSRVEDLRCGWLAGGPATGSERLVGWLVGWLVWNRKVPRAPDLRRGARFGAPIVNVSPTQQSQN